jgi:tRNA threonylcarbamoyladenosine biosynthesis protein TsaB
MTSVDETPAPKATRSTKPDARRILAIDTALGACSVCVSVDGQPEPLVEESQQMTTGQAEAIMPMIERVMSEIEGGFSSLDRVAVSIGPGSFTGLRIGISAARAIGLAAGIPVVGVSTLSAYAAPQINTEEPGVIAIGIDARHGSLFFQAFTSAGRSIILPRVITVKEASRLVGSGPVRIAGSGAPALAVETMSLGIKATIVDMNPAPTIAWVARLGLAADPATALAKPLYLRPPGATPQVGKSVPRA